MVFFIFCYRVCKRLEREWGVFLDLGCELF